MWHGTLCCFTLLMVPVEAVIHGATRHGTTKKQAGNIRFLSFIGTEGSGHHLLTPILRKVMNLTLVDTQDVGPARHISQASFLGGDDVFNAFMADDADALHTALKQHQPGELIQQAYSFPTKFHHRNADSRLFDLSSLYRMLASAGVDQMAVVRYERPAGDCARSVFKRWPSLCSDSLQACEEQQTVYGNLIEKHLDRLSKMQVPILRIGMDLLHRSLGHSWVSCYIF